MTLRFRPRLRHPFFPALAPTLARRAHGRVEALCGNFSELMTAAQRNLSVRRAIFVLIPHDAAPLDERQRDRLWDLFQVPVYAMVMGPSGVVAFECEAHDGYHVATSCDEDHHVACECGRPGTVVDGARWETARAPLAEVLTHGV